VRKKTRFAAGSDGCAAEHLAVLGLCTGLEVSFMFGCLTIEPTKMEILPRKTSVI